MPSHQNNANRKNLPRSARGSSVKALENIVDHGTKKKRFPPPRSVLKVKHNYFQDPLTRAEMLKRSDVQEWLQAERSELQYIIYYRT